jgi:hypothetical protein
MNPDAFLIRLSAVYPAEAIVPSLAIPVISQPTIQQYRAVPEGYKQVYQIH